MVTRCTVRNESEFVDTLRCVLRYSLPLAEYILKLAPAQPPRTVLGRLLQESWRLEELLDAHGARTNQKWLLFRRGVAALKLFSDVHYKLLHLKYSIPLYALMKIEEDVVQATDQALGCSNRLLASALEEFLVLARRYDLYPECAPYEPCCIEDEEVFWRLPNDLVRTAVQRKPDETVVGLATTFLNEVEGSDLRGVYAGLSERGFCDCVPLLACEKDFRRFEDVFHNLQALYDSYIGGTDLEHTDPKLTYLRGHATIIFHLFEIVTGLTHHYERHLIGADGSGGKAIQMKLRDMAWIVVSYAIEFAMLYATSAQNLCRDLIRSYTEQTTLTLPAPPYRGFHVRPSTLIARIVRHYGSEVTLEIEDERCDASSPLEMIRVNERINAIKRREVGRELGDLTDQRTETSDYREALEETLLTLFRRNRLIIYSRDLKLEDISPAVGESLGEYARHAIAKLLAEGRIDIQADIRVVFHGDKRALEDIKVLADAGYGEDQFGKNVPLPPELAYLKR